MRAIDRAGRRSDVQCFRDRKGRCFWSFLELYAASWGSLQDHPIHPEQLRSTDEKINSAAWSSAYPLLWEAGMRIARLRLAGDPYEADREDIVSTALQQFIRGLIGAGSESFNQIETWNDCLAMMRHIVRLRVTDFLRARERNREDAAGDLPEFPSQGVDEPAFTLTELLREVDTLEPDPPVPEVFRDRFLEGRSTDEIAQSRGINRNTLVSYYAKGLRALRERLTRFAGHQP